jgi:recombination protein RecT
MSEQQTNGVATRPPSKIEVLKNIMKAPSIQEQFNNVLKENSGAFVASIIDLYNSDKNLQNCDPKQVVMEALKAAVLKLPINKSLGFSYIIPFNESYQEDGQWKKRQVPQMLIGYKGYIQLAMRTGQYRIINADKVFEGEYVTKNKLTGEFDLSGKKTSDKVVGYFAHFEILNGFSKTLYMTVEQVINHAKKYSKSYGNKNSPWTTEFDDMANKTLLRGLLTTWGYLSIEMVNAFTKDIEAESVEDNVNEIISTNANKEEMKFEEAEEVKDETKTDDGNPI